MDADPEVELQSPPVHEIPVHSSSATPEDSRSLKRLRKSGNSEAREVKNPLDDDDVFISPPPTVETNKIIYITEDALSNASSLQRFEDRTTEQLAEDLFPIFDQGPKLREIMRRNKRLEARLSEVYVQEQSKGALLELRNKNMTSELQSLREASARHEQERGNFKEKLEKARLQVVEDFMLSAACDDLKKKAVEDFKVSPTFNSLVEDLLTPLAKYGFKKGLKAAKKLFPTLSFSRFSGFEDKPKAALEM